MTSIKMSVLGAVLVLIHHLFLLNFSLMTDERQILIPQAFLQIYKDPRTERLRPSRAWLEERHELCEDFSQLLLEQVRNKMIDLRITESDAVERIARGLDSDPAPLSLSALEINWIKSRLSELLREYSPYAGR